MGWPPRDGTEVKLAETNSTLTLPHRASRMGSIRRCEWRGSSMVNEPRNPIREGGVIHKVFSVYHTSIQLHNA
ncbi:MAG: hypothetical protein MjAS7_2859 [Metallosphaera javensis (ex Sakai et al. 2022)]|nr:MAG: hypothetical protein MjAS7_2859 [Metallosphaera javensis (ex Sakai et al. 2022)]